VHTHHTYTLYDVLVARRLSGGGRPRIVLTNHEAEILDRDGRTLSWHPSSHLRNWLPVKRDAAHRADFVIFVARQLATVMGFNGRHAVIPCGIDLRKYRPLDRLECRRRLGVPEDAMVIFFPANPHNQRKRFPLAKEALVRVQREVDGAIMLTGGGIAADDMPVLYNAADVVLQTSYCEASPTVVKEALGCEVPVVSTDAGDSRQVMDGVQWCAISGDDPDELAKHLLAARGRRALNARQRLIDQELDLAQVAKRIVGVYEQVLDKASVVGAPVAAQ
jgi:glycosyltransferase involved in cell wall biosynthesis